MTASRVLFVSLALLALVATVQAGTCYDARAPAGSPKVGDCVATQACVSSPERVKRVVSGLCTADKAAPDCCLDEKVFRAPTPVPAPAVFPPRADVTPPTDTGAHSVVNPQPNVVYQGPGCVRYSTSTPGKFLKGTCSSSGKECPAGFTGYQGPCDVYSSRQKCCVGATDPGTSFVVPKAAPKIASQVLAPTDKWTLEFTSGEGVKNIDKTEFINGKSVVTGQIPYALGTLTIKAGTGEVVETFQAVSGPMGRGVLPNEAGSGYTVSLKEGPRAHPGFPDEAGFGFKFFINPNKPAGFGRTALLIHPSANPMSIKSGGVAGKLPGGTEGCIGILGGHEKTVLFYNMLQEYLNTARTIQLTVNLANNPNVGRA